MAKNQAEKKRFGKGLSEGFTLVELLVTISIFAAITMAFFFNYPEFRESTALKRTAQKIALSIRQAQVYALSVKGTGGAGAAFPGYGAHFEIGSPKSFVLFKDLDNGNDYDGEAEKELEFRIRSGDRIVDLCGNVKSFPPGECGLPVLDVVYLRPRSDVTLRSGSSDFADAEIVVGSAGGKRKTIVVWSTGRIGVE